MISRSKIQINSKDSEHKILKRNKNSVGFSCLFNCTKSFSSLIGFNLKDYDILKYYLYTNHPNLTGFKRKCNNGRIKRKRFSVNPSKEGDCRQKYFR